MRGHGAKFSRKMEEAVVALLTQRNHDSGRMLIHARQGTAVASDYVKSDVRGSPRIHADCRESCAMESRPLLNRRRLHFHGVAAMSAEELKQFLHARRGPHEALRNAGR